MCVTYVRTYVCLSVSALPTSSALTQNTVMYVRTCVPMSVLLQLKASSEKEVASLKAHKDLEVGELNVRVRELSRQLQLASTSSSAPSPPAPTVTVQCSTTATEGKPIAKRARRKR